MNALNGVEELDGEISTGFQGFLEHIPELLDVDTPFLAEVGGEDTNEQLFVGTDSIDSSLIESFWLEDEILRILLII